METFRNNSKKPYEIHRKVNTNIENAIVVLRDSFNWGTHKIAREYVGERCR